MVKSGDGPSPEGNFPGAGKKERIKINVVRLEQMGRGRVKVKIDDTKSNIIDMNHNGKDYVVMRNLGRGRYIMREIESNIGVMTNGRYRDSIRPNEAQ